MQSFVKLFVKENLVIFINETSLESSLFSISFKFVIILRMFLRVQQSGNDTYDSSIHVKHLATL